MTPEEAAVVRAALEWWRMKRPKFWDARKHLLDPTTGTSLNSERDLAFAVADLARSGQVRP